MVHAIRVHETGGPDVMKWEEIEVGEPGEGEVRVRHEAVGLNFIDCYFRSGLYKTDLPYTPGAEAAGIIDAVGPGVTDLAVGDPVSYGTGPLGAYAEMRVMPALHVVKRPDAIDATTGAAMMLQGMTVEYLLTRTYKVQPGDTILFHAAAGGVGLIACQWAKSIGATVIGTVGSPKKAALARAHGCDHTILYKDEDFVAKVKEITGGKGVPVVYDSVGKDTFMKSLDCLAPLGFMVSFGNSSGPVDPFSPAILAPKGSLYVTRPTLGSYASSREKIVEMANNLFDKVTSGAVKIEVNQTYALKDAPQAHSDLEARKTTGSTVYTV